jgi:hypothetical protein
MRLRGNGSMRRCEMKHGHWLGGLLGLGSLLLASSGAAADAPSVDASVQLNDGSTSSDGAAGAVLLAGKLGGIASFNGLSPFPHFGIEAGYRFGAFGGRLAAVLAAEYTAPSADGKQTEAFIPERIPGGGTYSWELRQKELVLQPTFFYRLTGLIPRLTPYAGLGPRIYFLESVVRGKAGDQSFQDTPERSMKLGFGVPLGVEFELGPGGLFGELLPQWAPLKHTTTGDTHLGGTSLFVGYRAAL